MSIYSMIPCMGFLRNGTDHYWEAIGPLGPIAFWGRFARPSVKYVADKEMSRSELSVSAHGA